MDKLYDEIKNRQKELPRNSYVALLFKEGKNRIAQKVGEEAIEVIIAAAAFDAAAKDKSKKRVIEETADLWFHSLVLLAALNIRPKDVFDELEKRRKRKKKYDIVKI